MIAITTNNSISVNPSSTAEDCFCGGFLAPSTAPPSAHGNVFSCLIEVQSAGAYCAWPELQVCKTAFAVRPLRTRDRPRSKTPAFNHAGRGRKSAEANFRIDLNPEEASIVVGSRTRRSRE